jgi:hypothetical protein
VDKYRRDRPVGLRKTIATRAPAIQVINRQPEAQGLHNYIPFLVHIADVDLPIRIGRSAPFIIEIITDRAPVIDILVSPPS